VLWIYDEIIDGAPDVINKFKESGKEIFFVTNNSTKTRPEFAKKAINMGFNVTEV
jgi:phosphoglycolate phosphatase